MNFPVAIILLIPIGFKIIVFAICISILKKKIKSSPNQSINNLLKKTFINMFYCWIIINIFDVLTNLIAPLSFINNSIPGFYYGYTIKYPSLFIANIIRDIYVVFIVLTNYYTFRSIKIIQHGVVIGLEKSKNILIILIYVLMIFVFAPLDIFTCEVMENMTFNTDPRWDLVLPQAIPIIIILYTITFLYSFIRVSLIFLREYKTIDTKTRKRLLFFILGYFFLILGIIYFAFKPYFPPLNNLSPLQFQIIGHLIWSLSPISFLVALKYE